MKNALKEITKLVIFGSALIVLQAFAFTEPTEAPPGGNVPAPINVGSVTQEKFGGLIVAGLRSRLDAFLATDGGNVGVGTIDPKAKADVEGDMRVGSLSGVDDLRLVIVGNDGILQAVNPEPFLLGVDCPSSPNYDSVTSGGVAAQPGFTTIAMPADCKSDQGCLIKFELFDSSGARRHANYDYVQDAGTNKWQSTYQKRGNKVNGDGSYDRIVPSFCDGALALRDDWVRSGYSEQSPDAWTARDTCGGKGMKVFICTYPASVDLF